MALDTDLKAFWRMNESQAYMPCEDSVGSNTLVSYKDPPVIGGIVGQGREFLSDSSHYLSAADHADLSLGSADCSILAWFRPPVFESETKWFDISKGNLSTAHLLEYSLRFTFDSRGSGSVDFSVYDTDSPYQDERLARANLSDVYIPDTGLPALWRDDTWYMVLGRWDDSEELAQVYLFQGNTVLGLPPDSQYLWQARPLGGESSRYAYGRSGDSTGSGFNAAYDGTGTLNVGRMRGSADDIYSDVSCLDCMGFWKRLLSDSEVAELYNTGQGLEYPFFNPAKFRHQQSAGPVIHPRPSSLYEGSTWDVGTTPTRAPAPDAGWMTQPTLPAWRTPERIQGWSYGNNFPQAAAVPLVSQWWIQSSEPVQDKEEKDTRSVSMMSPASDQQIVVPPAVPDPPTPPGPPLDNSEAIVSDDGYRPGRPDESSDRYRK